MDKEAVMHELECYAAALSGATSFKFNDNGKRIAGVFADKILALAQQRSFEEWQPIETAPKSGYIMGAWQDGRWYCRQMFYENDEWVCAASDRIHIPTHWMSLPGAPS